MVDWVGRGSLALLISVASASRISGAVGEWAVQRGPSRQPAGFGPGSTQALERRKTGELWGEPGSKSTWLAPGDFPVLSPLGDQLVSMAIPTPLAELEGPWGVTWSSPSGGSRRERPAPASTWQDECGPAATGSPLEPDQLCLTLPPGLTGSLHPTAQCPNPRPAPQTSHALSFISAWYPNHVLPHLWASASAWKASPSPICQSPAPTAPSSRKPSLSPSDSALLWHIFSPELLPDCLGAPGG